MRQTLRQGALGVAGLLTLFALWWLGVALFGAADGLSARFSRRRRCSAWVNCWNAANSTSTCW